MIILLKVPLISKACLLYIYIYKSYFNRYFIFTSHENSDIGKKYSPHFWGATITTTTTAKVIFLREANLQGPSQETHLWGMTQKIIPQSEKRRLFPVLLG